MKQIQTIVVKLLMFGLLLAGGLLLAHYYGVAQVRNAWAAFLQSIPTDPDEQWLLALLAGGGLSILGLFGLLPMPQPRPRCTVTFPSSHGTITIRLDSAYRVIHKLINKMPEVRACSFEMTPTGDGQELMIQAKARLNLIPGQSARTTALRVNNYIVEAVTNYLGLEDIVSMNLNVQDFTIDVEEQRRVLMDKPIHESDGVFLNPPFDLPDEGVRITGEEANGVATLPELSRGIRSLEPQPVQDGEQTKPDESPPLPPLMPEFPEAEEVDEAEFEEGSLPPLRNDEGEKKEDKDAWSY